MTVHDVSRKHRSLTRDLYESRAVADGHPTTPVERVDVDGVQPRVVDRRMLDDEAGVGQELHVISGQREELTVGIAGEHCHPPISLLQRNKTPMIGIMLYISHAQTLKPLILI